MIIFTTLYLSDRTDLMGIGISSNLNQHNEKAAQ